MEGLRERETERVQGQKGASDTSKLGGSVKRDPGTEGRAEAGTAKDPGAEESGARVTKWDPVSGKRIEAGGAKDPGIGDKLRPGEQSGTR